jgi:FlaG/FlaF family flagellin (archaellin)
VRHFRAIPFLIATVALAAVVAGTAFAAAHTKVAFKGTYVGKVTEKVDGQNVTAVANGAGKGTAVGVGKLSGVVKATTVADSPCAPFYGPGTISGVKGKLKVNVTAPSRGCAASEDERDNITVTGTAKVTGGTLKFRRAKGSLHFSGHYDRKSGAFNVTLTGPLTY